MTTPPISPFTEQLTEDISNLTENLYAKKDNKQIQNLLQAPPNNQNVISLLHGVEVLINFYFNEISPERNPLFWHNFSIWCNWHLVEKEKNIQCLSYLIEHFREQPGVTLQDSNLIKLRQNEWIEYRTMLRIKEVVDQILMQDPAYLQTDLAQQVAAAASLLLQSGGEGKAPPFQ